MKKTFLYYILLLCCVHTVFSQEKQIQGIVFDKDSKQRLSRVYIYNTSTHKGFYNNTKGEFTTLVRRGDVLVAALEGYLVDTISVQSETTLLFYLKRNSILLKEVIIRDSTLSAQERLNKNKEDYKDIYRKGSSKDILQIGGANKTGGVGLGIDALWNLLSREGKNARHLQEIIERDYREQMIDYRYSARLVNSVTGLSGDSLRDFMQQYRPSYNLIIEGTDYQLIQFIQDSFKRYKVYPEANRLPPLMPVTEK